MHTGLLRHSATFTLSLTYRDRKSGTVSLLRKTTNTVLTLAIIETLAKYFSYIMHPNPRGGEIHPLSADSDSAGMAKYVH